MVTRTICEDSVLNHGSKLPWMKRRSTNCQEQVAIGIIMNVPPWTDRYNQRTVTIKSPRWTYLHSIDAIHSACQMFARSNRTAEIEPKPTEYARRQSAACHEYAMSRKWLTDYPLLPRSGFELLAVKREGILPMISRWFAARSCKDQCEGMDKASRKLSLVVRKLILSIGRACFVKKQELYAMKFASLAEHRSLLDFSSSHQFCQDCTKSWFEKGSLDRHLTKKWTRGLQLDEETQTVMTREVEARALWECGEV
ncbi:hypothetical protein F2Q70_00035519 [Brassica cretica]|uniref:Uncharacterized protein n=1 Tax=Brassica cretica TaxID=69181 RepID=A0A8S9JT45_BRACR|nr:hypothetical protein F2Q70_00035519 [Brassica cretica]